MDFYSTTSLIGVVRKLTLVPGNFLLNRFFPTQQDFPSDEVAIEIEKGKRRLAPFCSPVVEGKIVKSLGSTLKTFKPPYIKDKREVNPTRVFKRQIGEQLMGSMTPAQREGAIIAGEVRDQRGMIDRRLEWMAARILMTGKVVVTGEGYPTTEIDFGRAAGDTINLTGGLRWGQPGVKPLADLEAWALASLKEGGGSGITDWVFGANAWAAFIADAAVQAEREIQAMGGPGQFVVEVAPRVVAGAVNKGMISNWQLWLYNEWFTDDAGVEQPMLNPDMVVGVSQPGSGEGFDGVRSFAAIWDPTAGFQALPYYPKSWITEDPAIRWIMMQSSPLLIPFRPDMSIGATVLNAA